MTGVQTCALPILPALPAKVAVRATSEVDGVTGAVVAAGADRPGAGGRRPSVLVVDDEPALREIVGAWARELGLAVTVASSGPEALACVERERPDALLTDVLMPGEFGGIELARRARALHPDLTILVASGFAGDGIEGLRELGLPLIEKPYRKAQVTAALREQIRLAAGR